MSSEDGDNQSGGFDDGYRAWYSGEEEVFRWSSDDAPQDWQQWGHSDVDGSHWSWEFGERTGANEYEIIHFDTFNEAMEQLEAIKDNPSEYIEGHIGNIGEIVILYDPYEDDYYIEVDAYVEY